MKMVRVGFTGTRGGLTAEQHRDLVQFFTDHYDRISEWHHGDCVGADEESHILAVHFLGVEKVFIHPPTDPKHRAWCESPNMLPLAPYLERDRAIVDATDMLVGAPKAGKPAPRSGTWYTIRYAKKQCRPVVELLA